MGEKGNPHPALSPEGRGGEIRKKILIE